MQRLKFSLLLLILAGLLCTNAALAAANLQLTIINHSGYPDNQVYLAWLGKPGNNPAQSKDDTYHITDWKNISIAIISSNDNHDTINGEKYANYSTTLNQLNKNATGHPYFELPPCPDASLTPKGIATSRLWLSFGKPLYFHIESSIKYSQPSVSDATEVNYYTLFDFFEIATTYDGGLNKFHAHADTTNVDCFAVPLVYELYDNGKSLGKKGIDRTRKEVYQAFSAVAPLRPLITPMRVVAPGHGQSDAAKPLYFDDKYFDSYRDYCWKHWDGKTTDTTLKIYYDGIWWSGYVNSENRLFLTGKVNNVDETHYIVFKDNKNIIHNPSSTDIFLCNGAFDGVDGPPGSQPNFKSRDADLKNQIASALNRSVMHKVPYPDPGTTPFPWGADIYVNDYYKNNNHLADNVFKTNIYSNILHQLAVGGKIYGFAYDDNNEQSSFLDGDATEVRLTINNSLLGGGPTWLGLLLLD